MINVTLVGTGNLSHHLAQVFTTSPEIQLIEVMDSRTIHKEALTNKGAMSSEVPDLYILAVSDDAISEVAEHFKTTEALVVHTSGSVGLSALAPINRIGVFYPLQTFSKTREVDFKRIPICIEAPRPEDMKVLHGLALAISDHVHEINSDQRGTLHLAAVFVNNFTNHLYQIGQGLCEKEGLSFDLLKPLIQETAQKIGDLTPVEAQTGPAKRNDVKTIKRHLARLQGAGNKEIYTILTKSITAVHGKKL